MTKLFYFNPTCEMEVANGLPSYMPPAKVSRLQVEGAFLPIYFSAPDDKVIVPKQAGKYFLDGLEQLGLADRYVLDKKCNTLKGSFDGTPWGWSPASINYLQKICENVNLPVWKTEHTQRYRRETALEIMEYVQCNLSGNVKRLPLPVACTRLIQVEQCMNDFGKVVVKAPLSSSGRGIQFLRKPGLHQANKQWIQGVIDEQGAIMVEPMYDRAFDFSMHFMKKESDVEWLGESAFITSKNGNYMGNKVGQMSENNLPDGFDQKLITEVKEGLTDIFQSHPTYNDYSGPLGVDMFIYKDGKDFHLHPCVEINARYSMGYMALMLQSYLASGTGGVMKSLFKKDVKEEAFHLSVEDKKISKCYWPLTDYWNAQQFVFMLEVN